LKCGEEKPQCQRCITTGRVCDGYSISWSPGIPPVKRSAKDLVMIHYTTCIPAAPYSAISRNAKERRAFDYFRTRTAVDLIACFDSELWSCYVLQLAQTEPAIRHAVIAIGSLHEHFETSAADHKEGSKFALQQYSTAIQQVLGSFKSSLDYPTEIALVLCGLFASFESLEGHYKSALTHIASGIKVLAEQRANRSWSGRPDKLTRLLENLFSRFGCQVLEIADISVLPGQSLEQNRVMELPLPLAFSDLEEAQDLFNSYLHGLLYFLDNAEKTTAHCSSVSRTEIETSMAEHANFVDYLKRWSIVFDRYVEQELGINSSSSHPDRMRMQPGVYILQIWRTVVNILLSLDLSAGEGGWDHFVNDFRSVIHLAEAFINRTAVFVTRNSADSKSTSGSTPTQGNGSEGVPRLILSDRHRTQYSSATPQTNLSHPSPQDTDRSELNETPPQAPKKAPMIKPTFSLSLGIIPALYITATRCRDPPTRRKAIHLLSICNRREGIWDAWLSSRVALRINEIEEAAARQYLYGDARREGDTAVEPTELTNILQIPQEVRVLHLGTSFGPDKEGLVRFMRNSVGPEGVGGEKITFEERFDW
jgi:hypothetical protein